MSLPVNLRKKKTVTFTLEEWYFSPSHPTSPFLGIVIFWTRLYPFSMLFFIVSPFIFAPLDQIFSCICF